MPYAKNIAALSALALVCTTALSACTAYPPVNGVSGGSDRAAVKVTDEKEETGLYNLAEKYEKLGDDNVFYVTTFEEMVKFREHGTGILVYGFASCPACNEYIPMLDELAREHGIEEIVYYDLEQDRNENGDNYKKVIELMSGYTKYNADGDERLFVPSVSFIDGGNIILYDDETSELGPSDPPASEYWTEERMSSWRDKLGHVMDEIKPKIEKCSECGSN